MAKSKDKKSFVLYNDYEEVFSMLTDEEAGKLIKHILAYVNNKNPSLEDRLLQVTFEPIRLQLGRDAKKYEAICERNAINGAKGGRPPKNPRKPKKPSGLIENPDNPVGYLETQGNPSEPKKADTDNDNDNDTDISYLEKSIKQKEIEFKKTIEPFVETYGRDTCNEFFAYWTEPNKSKTKLRFEMERTWDISRRLKRWANNNFKNNGNKEEEYRIKI